MAAWNDRWLTALAGRSTAAAKLLVVGDSNSEGQGATTKANRWLDRLLVNLRATYGVSGGGAGYVPSFYAVNADSTWQSFSSVTGTPTTSNLVGTLGYRTMYLQDTSSPVVTYPLTGTAVDIWWVGGGGSFSYQVDSGSQVTINTAGTYHTDYRTRVSLGTAGAHTVTIRAVSGQSAFGGFTVFNGDETAGIHIYDAARSGLTSGNMLTDGGELGRAIGTVTPDLVIMELGGNDAQTGISASDFGTNLGYLISGVLGISPRPSLLLMAVPNPAADTIATGVSWADYVAQMASAASANPTQIGFLDLRSYFPAADHSGTGYFSTDGIHPSNAGHELEYRVVQAAITAPTVIGRPSTSAAAAASGAASGGAGRLGVAAGNGSRSLAGVPAGSAVAVGRVAVSGGSAVSGSVSGAAVVAGRSSGGGSQARSSVTAGSATVTGSTGNSGGQSAGGTPTGTATQTGLPAANSSAVVSGSATSGTSVNAPGSVASSSAYSAGSSAAGAATTQGSTAQSSTAAAVGSTGQSATASGSVAASTAAARIGQQAGSATSQGFPASSSSTIRAGSTPQQVDATAVGAPATSNGAAAVGMFAAAALFAGGTATGSSSTVAGMCTATAVLVGRIAASTSRAASTAPLASPRITNARLYVQPNLAALTF